MSKPMTPLRSVLWVYNTEPCERSFGEDLTNHLKSGYVYSTPEYFCMGRGVNKDAGKDKVLDSGFTFKREEQNCWWIWAYSGDIEAMLSDWPYYLPFVGFQKKNIMKLYPYKLFRLKWNLNQKSLGRKSK